MPVSIVDRIGMMLRRTPVLRVVRCVKKAEAEGIDLDIYQIEAHSLCGGNIEAVTDGLIFAKQNGVDANWMTLCALDLSGRDIGAMLEQCVNTHTVTFATYTPDGKEPIQGYCADGQPVRATLTMDFKLPVRLAAPEAAKAALEQIQERLATRASVYIHTSPGIDALTNSRMTHESELVTLAAKIIATTEAIRIEYERV